MKKEETQKALKDANAKPKILVLDDEKEIVDVFSMLMHQFHYNADFFVDGKTALDIIMKDPNRYQLIVSDIKMPKMDGIAFAKKIREIRPDLPIIFMTGYPSEEIKNEILKLNKVTFLEKPFHLETTFQELIPKLLGQKGTGR